MTERKRPAVVAVDDQTKQKIKIIAALYNVTMKELLKRIIDREWEAGKNEKDNS